MAKKRKMRKQAKILLLSLVLVISLGSYYLYSHFSVTSKESVNSKEKTENIPISCFLGDIQYIDSREVIPYLKESQMTTITVPIVWSMVEKSENDWDFSVYDQSIKEYIKQGFRFIFILDASGRAVMNEKRESAGSSIPDYMRSRFLESFGRGSEGEISPGFDYADQQHLSYVEKFYTKSISYLEQYRDYIVALTPGIMSEFEIKYFQSYSLWNNYSDATLSQYISYLKKKYKTIEKMNEKTGENLPFFSSIELPSVKSATVNQASLKQCAQFSDFVDFREELLAKYVKNFTDIIHKNKYDTLGYFGQFHSSYDGIYSANAIDRMVPCFDHVVVDYNFYNGSKAVYNTSITPYLVNYAKNLGFKNVYAGVYFERINVPDNLEMIKEIKNKLSVDDKATGVEIGNIYPFSNNKLVKLSYQRSYKKNSNKKIALYVSKETFIRDNSELEEYKNYLTDTAVETYNILRFVLGYNVDVIGDSTIKNKDISKYQVVVAPTQFYVSDECMKKLEEYKDSGGAILSDIGLGQYDLYNHSRKQNGGVSTNVRESHRMRTLYKNGEKFLEISDSSYKLPQLPYTYPKGTGLYTDSQNKQIGYIGDREIVIGFQPQILYKQTEKQEYSQIYKDCIDYLTNN